MQWSVHKLRFHPSTPSPAGKVYAARRGGQPSPAWEFHGPLIDITRVMKVHRVTIFYVYEALHVSMYTGQPTLARVKVPSLMSCWPTWVHYMWACVGRVSAGTNPRHFHQLPGLAISWARQPLLLGGGPRRNRQLLGPGTPVSGAAPVWVITNGYNLALYQLQPPFLWPTRPTKSLNLNG